MNEHTTQVDTATSHGAGPSPAPSPAGEGRRHLFRSLNASALTARSRATWAAFAGASALVLGACLALALERDNPASVAVVLLGGLAAVGIGALLLVTATPPLPGQSGRWRVPPDSRRHAGGAVGAAVSGGLAGGSNCGGGGGGSCG